MRGLVFVLILIFSASTLFLFSFMSLTTFEFCRKWLGVVNKKWPGKSILRAGDLSIYTALVGALIVASVLNHYGFP